MSEDLRQWATVFNDLSHVFGHLLERRRPSTVLLASCALDC
jgi:hypothetical protein